MLVASKIPIMIGNVVRHDLFKIDDCGCSVSLRNDDPSDGAFRTLMGIPSRIPVEGEKSRVKCKLRRYNFSSGTAIPLGSPRVGCVTIRRGRSFPETETSRGASILRSAFSGMRGDRAWSAGNELGFDRESGVRRDPESSRSPSATTDPMGAKTRRPKTKLKGRSTFDSEG